MEDKLTHLNKFVTKTMKNAKIMDNLTHQQRTGLKSHRKREDLHISVSDKCGEFVVTTKETHKQVTSAHLELWMNFNSVNCTLPCLYVNVKMHKFDVNYFTNKVNPSDLKVRPIISCCNSSTEHLSWIVTQIISQFLQFIPTHLNSFNQHLDNLTSIHSQNNINQHFFQLTLTRCILT